MDFTFTKIRRDALLIIGLEGRLDATNALKLENELRGSLDGVTELVFDCAKLKYITSAGLRAILFAYRQLQGKGTITVINANEMVREVFDLTGFRAILTLE